MSEFDLPQRVANFLQRHQLAGQTVAVALSGGIDSIVLLDILARVDAGNISQGRALQAIHVHHGISANADVWAEFCRSQCALRGIPLTVTVVNVDRQAGIGLEAAAREARYGALMQSGAAFIASAQHQDDQAETVLHQMLRGTGLNGMAGMGELRELRPGQALLRPLLDVSRTEIEAYAALHQLQWIEDDSNDNTVFTRNFIRHELLPVISRRFPQYAASLSRAARHAAESAEMLESLAVLDLQWNGIDARADALDTLPLSRQVNALYHWLRWQKAAAPSRLQLADWAMQLFRAPPAGKAQQAGGHIFVIRRKQNRLMLLPGLRVGSKGCPSA